VALHDRVHFFIIVDSVGYYEGLIQLCQALGVYLPMESLVYLQCRDHQRKYMQHYHKQPHVKGKQSSSKREMIKEGLVELQHDRSSGQGYALSIALKDSMKLPKKKLQKAKTTCIAPKKP